MRREGAHPVLLVDDDADTREAFGLLLEADGFAVVTSESAVDALRLLDTAEPAAIVMDLHMPEMDGYEFRERQRAMPTRRDVPFLAVSGSADRMEEVATRLGIPAAHASSSPSTRCSSLRFSARLFQLRRTSGDREED